MILSLVALLAAPAQVQPATSPVNIRVGLETRALEVVVSLEGGGWLTDLEGRRLLALKEGEKARLWWDSRGEADPDAEVRVQVGPPLDTQPAEALVQRLKAMGLDAERVKEADGDNWRILAGRFRRPLEAEGLLGRLAAAGFTETWAALEKRPVAPRVGRALYAITEQYERIPLPVQGVRLAPAAGLSLVQGKGRYRGLVDVVPNAQGRLSVINTLDLETYLRGVVPRELGPGEYPNLEALKAQAVAARTYAYANRGKRAKEGFDLLDTVADQVYGGRDGEASLTDQAVRETAGLIATYRGRPIQALFTATSGGATVDNEHVFRGGQAYLAPASNYLERATTLPFTGRPAPRGSQAWLTPELLRLAGLGLLEPDRLQTQGMTRPLQAADLQSTVEALCRRLSLPLPAPAPASTTGPEALLWAARSLGFGPLPEGQTRPQDADYFLGTAPVRPEDRLLAAFLVRRGHLSPSFWQEPPTLAQGLHALGRLWAELEEVPFQEGTLLRDGTLRPKGREPLRVDLAPAALLAVEYPGGALRLVDRLEAQVGDRLRWIAGDSPSPILVRRLDPDGAAMDRYNPTAHWRQEVKEADLNQRLRDRLGLGPLARFETRTNDQGRVLELRVVDTRGQSRTLTGMRIRLLLGLKDNVFRWVEVGRRPERRFVFFGRGWGHGVGMDQTGAYGLGLEGRTFEQILKHYYRGIELQPLKP